MIHLSTPVELPKGVPSITHAQQLLLMGSCFAENMGRLLIENSFRCDVNPFGILYNPLSVAEALGQIIAGRVYQEKDLFFFRDCWHSAMHHGVFSSASPAEAVQAINGRLRQAHEQSKGVDWLLLTWGTAFVYEQRETRELVSNCHKQPEKLFTRRKLSVAEIVDRYRALLNELWRQNPGARVLLTISPIRHARDGMHANQLSKATLLLATEQLQALFPQGVYYFPSYEIVLDELRDYRYYADDMLHPSPLAVRYLWERFGETFFSDETILIMQECENIRRGLAHKPFRPESEEYKSFLGQIVLKIERLNEKYPYLDFEKETKLCHIPLNPLPKK